MTNLEGLALVTTLLYLISIPVMTWVRTWGSTENERGLVLPGEDLLKNRKITCTHAVSIDAPPETIWPYLVQIGQTKAGFYSYRWLENLVGCQMPDHRGVVPEFQSLKVGDPVYLHPKAPPLKVTVLIPNQVLAFEGWYLALIGETPTRTRLIARGYDWRDPARPRSRFERLWTGPIFDIAHFIMERKMLLNIKSYVESRTRPVDQVSPRLQRRMT